MNNAGKLNSFNLYLSFVIAINFKGLQPAVGRLALPAGWAFYKKRLEVGQIILFPFLSKHVFEIDVIPCEQVSYFLI